MATKLQKKLRPVSGILLVTGTCIGAGMLALPVVTGIAGFLPAMAINLLCCLFMMATGLLFLEAILWVEDGANVLTLAHRFLGNKGKIFSGLAFLFLYYCLEVSYFAGGAPAFASAVAEISGIQLQGSSDVIAFGLVFGAIVFFGATMVDRLNWLLMTGLFISFFLLIGVGSREVKAELLHRADWRLSLAAAPVLFGAYGYHNLLPTLSTYLKRDIAHLRIAVIMGSLVPFAIYSLWQWMIIGTLSIEEIQGADLRGEPITQTLQNAIGHPFLRLFGEYFGFFALVTSFLGVSLSMVDFLGDGLKVRREGWARFALCLAVFIPPAILAAYNPGIFIEAIGVAGGYGEAILNGLLPIAMVWVGRYQMRISSSYSLAGGKTMLILLLMITLLIMGIETHHLFFS